jgi:hypothetical protein
VLSPAVKRIAGLIEHDNIPRKSITPSLPVRVIADQRSNRQFHIASICGKLVAKKRTV